MEVAVDGPADGTPADEGGAEDASMEGRAEDAAVEDTGTVVTLEASAAVSQALYTLPQVTLSPPLVVSRAALTPHRPVLGCNGVSTCPYGHPMSSRVACAACSKYKTFASASRAT